MSEQQYDLVMPFVTVTSKGGPHDDASYTAGYQMGLLDHRLATGHLDVTVPAVVATDCLPQADLLAMRHGWQMTVEDRDNESVEGWERVTFEPVDSSTFGAQPWLVLHPHDPDGDPYWLIPTGGHDEQHYAEHDKVELSLEPGCVDLNGETMTVQRTRQLAACLLLAADKADATTPGASS